ncbi:MAG: radical SAM protein [Planctomycetota bacterium]|jgi:radical SAM protein with 4Fe4S-binding SPASM domain
MMAFMEAARRRRREGAGAWLAPLVARLYLRRPEVAELVAIKYGSPRALAGALYNEILFRLGRLSGYRLLSANFEVTNACNLNCTICPVNRGMRRRKARHDLASFERFLDRNPGLGFLLLFQWGEPLLVKELPEMIDAAGARGIRTMITTNGTLLDAEWSRRLIDAGLTRLTLSVDGDPETHRRIRGVELEPLRVNLRRLRRMRDESGSALGIDVSMVVNRLTERTWRDVRAAWSAIADRIQAIPQFMVKRRRNPCREPSRGSLVVLADGSVTVCCSDPEGDAVVGHCEEASLQEILNNEKMRAFRRAHFERRFPDLCRECGEYSTQVASPRFER